MDVNRKKTLDVLFKNKVQKKNIKQSNVFLMTLDALGNYNIIKKE